MSVELNLLAILKFYATHQNSALVPFNAFCEYMKRYAQKHVQEAPNLSSYISNPQVILKRELGPLADARKIHIFEPAPDKRLIVVIPFLADKVHLRYQDMQTNSHIPFPTIADLPKNIPLDALVSGPANDIIMKMFAMDESKNPNTLYVIDMPRELPPVLLSSTTSISMLLNISMTKIRTMLRKEEYREYFMKKLCISNPGKELSAKQFFTNYIMKDVDAVDSLKDSGEAFYFWGQQCFFIRQDYDKVKDYTAEDIALLQAVVFIELAVAFYKTQEQQSAQREAALKVLEQNMDKPPFYFDHKTITKFTDSHGVPLLGQYSDEALREWLHDQTTGMTQDELPPLLTFRTPGSDDRFYIFKKNVISLVMRMCSDAREKLKADITKEWFEIYSNFDSVPEMTNQDAYEKYLEHEVRTKFPVLFAVLNSNFLSLVQYEQRQQHDENANRIVLFDNGKLLDYSILLALSRQEINTDVRIMLPFWYTTPILSWFMSLFLRKKVKKAPKKKTQSQKSSEDREKAANRRQELVKAAKTLEGQLVPEGSTLERELEVSSHEWNKIIDPIKADQALEDVNSLIRDYLRTVVRSLQGSQFTMARIENLADGLIKSQSLASIKQKDRLYYYIKLYLVMLVKSMK
ncbi:MAG: hypothetical protein KBT02_11225 [Treponema sp.]|nr:hypothetical protein [Candidatus Treponema caballi]